MDLNALALPDIILRLVVSFLIGALIGLERERHQRPAGLRTHTLVCLASALFAMVSIIAAGANNDPGRIAAQVVTGIGFLGAGTIMRQGSTVRGLTTAASLWMASALGLAVGFGWYVAAILAGLMAFLALTMMKLLEERLAKRQLTLNLAITAAPGQDPLPRILTTARVMGADLQTVRFGPESLAEGLHFIIALAVPASLSSAGLAQALEGVEGVRDVEPGQ